MCSADEGEVVSNIFLIRHGDRFDYANMNLWLEKSKDAGCLVTDPPLSKLGHKQASETAQYLSSNALKSNENDSPNVVILSSPYLRVIQTSRPLSDTLEAPIHIEHGLAEAHCTPNILPAASDRYPYFPQMDMKYNSLVQPSPSPGYFCHKTKAPCEAFAGHYVKRMEKLASCLSKRYFGKTVVCYSHAASTALIAALARCRLDSLKFAPCGIYHLQRIGPEGNEWKIIHNGGSNESHVSENSSTTYPWGYGEKHFKENESMTYHGESENIGLDYFVN